MTGFSDFRRRITRPDVQVVSLDKREGKDPAAYVRLFRLLRTLRPSIVHTRNIGTLDCQCVAAAAGVRRRVHGEHGWVADDPQGRNSKNLRFRRLCAPAVQRYVPMSLDIAAWLRRGTDGRKLAVFFYGYLFEFAPLQNGAPTSGHYALSGLLGGRDLDILCSPISYTDREWVGTAPCMSVAESVREAGILWLNEDDSRTFLDLRTAEHVQEGGLVDLEQTRQVMLRNTAQEALRGFGSWWMDLPAQGWFNDARIWQEMVRLQPVDDAMLRRSRPFTPDVAMITDEDSMCHLTGGSAEAAQPLTYSVGADFGRMGTPYGQYLLGDVLAEKVPARIQVFVSAWAVIGPATRSGCLSLRRYHAGQVLGAGLHVPRPARRSRRRRRDRFQGASAEPVVRGGNPD